MRNDWINCCLSSLRDSTIKTIPIVVDNCSTDGTREFAPTQYPEVVWLPQNKNLGFGQANNIGIRYALENNADYVLLLNQDASLHKEAIRYMLEASDGTSLISPLHLNGKGSGFDNIFRLYSLPLNSGILED
ncbi:MAG: glycosyltransferase, partial [Prevotella sp.]|nr:glycosyltransferase [Prevotella sp.]